MDIISWLLARKYCDNSIKGISGVLSGKNCTIDSATKSGNLTTVIFKWTADDGTTRTTQIEVKDGETPAFSSVAITGGHRLTFTTQDPTQSVSFNVMDGAKGDTGISVVASNVDDNNNLTLTLSNGNVINAGKIKAVTTVDNALSTTSSNPVENKVITNALNNKVDKEMGKGLFSDEEKAKLANIEDGAQVNVLEKLIVNGQEATITDKSIALTLITSAVSNLQNYYLKTETYTKQEVEDLIGSTVGVTIEIVEQLPTEGQSNVIYFLPTETEGVYSQYIYSNNSWILIGSTTVDLSNYYTKAQVDTLLNGKQNVLTIDSFPTPLSNNPVASGGVYTAIAQMQPQFQFANMPTASSTNLGFVYQYTGATGTYTQNMFYRCIYDDVLGEYRWEEVIFHATVTVDSAISGTSTNPVQNKVIKEALDTKQDIMQYSTMPSAQDNLGKIVQYIGTNTSNYTNGYFYKAIYDSESDVYLWTVIKFSADMLVDNALSTTSENPVQNKVITGAINEIQGVIPSEASSTNQLVDRDSLGTASQKNFTPYVSPDNTDVPISSSVYSAITSAVYGAYHPSGSKTIAELTSDLLVFANIGNVYKITEDGVTTNLFVGGAGQTIHTGDNAVVVYGGQPNTFLFDLQSGSIDLTPYQTKALASAVEGETTVEGALGALSTNKQAKTLSTSVESQTTVEGALGALSTNKATQAEVNDIVNVLGAKNFINNTSISETDGKVQYTVNSDKSISINILSTLSANAGRIVGYINVKAGLTYILTGGVSNKVRIDFRNSDYSMWTDNAQSKEVTSPKQSYSVDTFTPNNDATLMVYIRIDSSTETGNVGTVYPMLRLASDPDNTYVPYSRTNQELTGEVAPMLNILGAKNLLPNKLVSQTISGITYSVNSDGTINMHGTNTSSDWVSNNFCDFETLKNVLSQFKGKRMIFSITSNYDYNTNNVCLYYNIGGTSTYVTPNPREVEFVVPNNIDTATAITVPIGVNSNKTANTYNLGIMLRPASIQDNTYEPYAMTNQQITPYVQAISNPNLLDNPWFTVNQRDVTNAWNAQFSYGVDRWRKQTDTSTTLSVTANGITEVDGKAFGIFQIVSQIDEEVKSLYGKTLTLSVMYSDGTIDKGSALLPSDHYSPSATKIVRFVYNTAKCDYLEIESYTTGKTNIVASMKAGVTIKAVKLELGSVSTLAMDTAPNYQQELAKCQRYFQRIYNPSSDYPAEIGVAMARTTSVVPLMIPYVVPMRGIPSITISTNAVLYTRSDSASAVVSSGVSASYGTTLGKVLNINGSSLTVGEIYRIMLAQNAHIDFSADL